MDEGEIVCYKMVWQEGKPIVTPVATQEYEALPEFVMETLNVGCVSVHDGFLYGNSPDHCLGEFKDEQ